MRIDAHQHFWDLEKLSYSWMPADPSPLRRTFLPADLAPILERNRFDGSIFVQATMADAEAEWALALADANPFLKGVVAWTDLTSDRVGARLDALMRHPKFKGIRHPTHDEQDANWILRADVTSGLRELEARDIPFDLLLRPQHLPLVPELAARLPKLRMVIDHIAKPPIASGSLAGWDRDIANAASCPNVYCKLSGMITEADWTNWKPADLAPFVQHVLAVFPPDRLMFGSDWPVCLQAGSWKQALAAFTQAIGAQPQAVRDKILGETAIAFYALTLLTGTVTTVPLRQGGHR